VLRCGGDHAKLKVLGQSRTRDQPRGSLPSRSEVAVSRSLVRAVPPSLV